MLEAYEPIRRNVVMREMRKDEKLAVVAESVHPERRYVQDLLDYSNCYLLP